MGLGRAMQAASGAGMLADKAVPCHPAERAEGWELLVLPPGRFPGLFSFIEPAHAPHPTGQEA